MRNVVIVVAFIYLVALLLGMAHESLGAQSTVTPTPTPYMVYMPIIQRYCEVVVCRGRDCWCATVTPTVTPR